MITKEGYSKDTQIMPEGIVVTFGREMINEQGGLLCFLRNFEETMADENAYWMHKCKNQPKHDILYVYMIVCNRLYGRCHFGGYNTDPTIGFTADGNARMIEWPKILLTGPLFKPNFKRALSGFRGFRYSTQLF